MATRAKGARAAKGAGRAGAHKRGPVGCLVWVALLLIIAVAFFALRVTIARSIGASGLTRALGAEDHGSSPAPADQAAAEPSATPEPPPRDPPAVAPASAAPPAPEASPATNAPSAPAASSSPAPRQTQAREATPTTAAPARRQPESRRPVVAAEPQKQTRRGTLYFARVTESGAITVSGIQRSVSFVDAPLSDTLGALVAGPTAAEKSQGYRTLIPAGTKIEQVRVEGATAFISFNEPFRFNSYGRDAMEAQLEQVVFTATEFSNVSRVQVLIGGKVTEFLGQEGVRIRDPLTRESFTDGDL